MNISNILFFLPTGRMLYCVKGESERSTTDLDRLTLVKRFEMILRHYEFRQISDLCIGILLNTPSGAKREGNGCAQVFLSNVACRFRLCNVVVQLS